MFKWLSNYRKKKKEKSKKEQYNTGYDYAAGKLLRNECTPLELESYIDYDPFDYGMIDAINKLCDLGVVEDNRF